MATFYLIRHGMTEMVKRGLTGRLPGIGLNSKGLEQAARLAERLAGEPVAAIYSSPMQRALETAAPIAERLGLPVQQSEPFTEVDFGEWSGREIAELEGDEQFRLFNTFRSGTRIPGGELMLEAQARATAELARLHERHGDSTVVIVSHGDIIRAVLGYYLGSPLDFILRLEVSPGSLSIVELEGWGPRVLRVNEV